MLSTTKQYITTVTVLVTLLAWGSAATAAEPQKKRTTSTRVDNSSAKHKSPTLRSSPLVKEIDDYVLDYTGANYFLNGENGWADNNGNSRSWAEGFGVFFSPDFPPQQVCGSTVGVMRLITLSSNLPLTPQQQDGISSVLRVGISYPLLS